MNPARKRTVRLVVSLSAAVVLASALIYTSFSAASPALTPSQFLREVQPGRSYQVTGDVVDGSVHRANGVMYFSVADRVGGGSGAGSSGAGGAGGGASGAGALGAGGAGGGASGAGALGAGGAGVGASGGGGSGVGASGGGSSIPVAYTGAVPDAFHEGREIIVTVEQQGNRYIGERESLITKCPSKYKVAPPSEKQNY